MAKKLKIMVVAGEASGDAHAAKLISSLRGMQPNVEFFGSAGRLMREAGAETIIDADGLSIMGLPEVARALPMFLKVFKKLKQAALEQKPDAVVLVDFPEFNMKFAKSLKKLGFKIIYYISPQLWAWRRYRIRGVRRDIDLMLTILPFEKEFYEGRGVENVEFVGNPLAGEVKSTLSKEEFCKKYGLDTDSPIIALLPGSRRKEVERILPVMLESAALMHGKDEKLQFIAAFASARDRAEYENAASKIAGLPENIAFVRGETFEALNASDAAAVTSGTATLETAIIGTPMVVVYKTSALNWKIFRPLISTDHFALVNLIAGERLVTELIHENFDPVKLSEELFGLLEEGRNAEMRKRLAEVKESLGEGGTSKRAAEAILKLING